MNFTSVKGKNPFYIIFGIIAFFLAVCLIFKPVMKWFYPVNYIDEIKKYSNQYNLDKHLLMAIISAESKFDEDAVRRKNAKGLMQLKEETARWCMEQFKIEEDNKDIYDPDLNIHLGCAYMRYLLDKFSSDTHIALAAYNAGEGNVTKWLNNQEDKTGLDTIPFKETENYVKTVENRTKIYKFLY